MKKVFIYGLLAMGFMSCEKELPLKEIEFEVGVDQNTYYVGDAVTFNFTGTPEFISFYSGEVGNDYDSIGGRIMPAELYMSFENQISAVIATSQHDQFSVHVSTDFSGNYTVESVNAATWTNLNDRFYIATPEDNEAYMPSGKVSISDLNMGEGPLFVAFRYQQRPANIHGRRCNWRVRNFFLEGVTDEGPVTLADNTAADWSIVEDGPWVAGRIQKLATGIGFLGHLPAQGADVDLVGWAISVPFVIGSVVDLGPDRAVPIKALADEDLLSYTHVYNEPGTYKVTFVAANANLESRKEVIRQLEMVVLPKD